MKVLLVATVQSHICQFHKPLVKMLHDYGYEVHVAAHNNLAQKNGLELDFVDEVFEIPFERSPLNLKNVIAYRRLKKLLESQEYDIIHCNTPVGGIVGRIAAKRFRKRGTQVIYTAHGFHFYKGAPIKNWLIYYPIEKFFANYYTDKLITISEYDYCMAMQMKFKVPLFRIHSVGINSVKYHPISKSFIDDLRKENGYAVEDFICVCTGELNKNKNQRALIECVPQIIKNVPNFKLLLAGNGPEKNNLECIIDELGLRNNVILLGYRTDLENFVQMADMAISVSIREGLGINLIEAMTCKKPVIGSCNRGHQEFINDGVNGYLVQWDNIRESIVERVTTLAHNADKREKMGDQAYRDATLYSDNNVVMELQNIYFGKSCKNGED